MSTLTPVLLQSNALLTLDEARAFFPAMTGTEQDDLLTDLINRASDYCEAWCNRPIKARTYTDLRIAWQYGCHLRPPATPIDVTQPILLMFESQTLSVWKSEADGDPTLKDVVIGADVPGAPSFFYRAIGWQCSTSQPSPIRLTYTGGLAQVPGDIRDATFLVMQTLHRQQSKGQTDVVSMSNAITGTTVFRQDSLIPLKAAMTLDRYRLLSV